MSRRAISLIAVPVIALLSRVEVPQLLAQQPQQDNTNEMTIYAAYDPLTGKAESTTPASGSGGPQCAGRQTWQLVAEVDNVCYWFAPYPEKKSGYIVPAKDLLLFNENELGTCIQDPFDASTAICQHPPASSEAQPEPAPLPPAGPPAALFQLRSQARDALNQGPPQPGDEVKYRGMTGTAIQTFNRQYPGHPLVQCASPYASVFYDLAQGSTDHAQTDFARGDACAHAFGLTPPAAATPAPEPTPVVPQDSLMAFQAFVDSVPGLARAFETGASITRQQVDAMRDEWFRNQDTGIRLAIDELSSEGYAAGVTTPAADAGSAIGPQLERLLAHGVDARGPGATIDASTAAAVARLIDSSRGGVLAKAYRAANPTFNRLLYLRHAAQLNRLDFRGALLATLEAGGVNPAAAGIVANNIEDSYRFGEQAGAFDGTGWQVLRLGRAAPLAGWSEPSGIPAQLSVGQLIPKAIAPGLIDSLANLRWEALYLNRTEREELTPQMVAFGKKLFAAGEMSQQDYQRLIQAAKAQGFAAP